LTAGSLHVGAQMFEPSVSLLTSPNLVDGNARGSTAATYSKSMLTNIACIVLRISSVTYLKIYD
jgi:hypothetical protein